MPKHAARRSWISGLFILFFPLWAMAFSVPKATSTPTRLHIRFPLKNKRAHVLLLQHPARLVIDQRGGRKQMHQLDRWKRIMQHRPGVAAIRVAMKGSHTVRLVVEVKRGWQASSQHKRSTLYFYAKHAPTWLDRAAQPIHLKPIRTTQPAHLKPINDSRPYPSKQKLVIVLDPGHGGKDPGATGPRGYHEKNIVLGIARRLARKLNHSRQFKAYLTRRSDRYITLRRRLQFARRHHADLFISIHADAFRNQHSHGASIFALSQRGATSEAARWIAQKENDSELMGGVDLDGKSQLLRSVLINLSQTASIRDSLTAGQSILRELRRTTHMHHNKIEQAAFVVLKSPDIPSLLVETGFISNAREERKLSSPRHQEAIAQALYRGIIHYFNS